MASLPVRSTKHPYEKLSVMTCLVLAWFHVQAPAAFWSVSWIHVVVAMVLYWVAGGLGISGECRRLNVIERLDHLRSGQMPLQQL